MALHRFTGGGVAVGGDDVRAGIEVAPYAPRKGRHHSPSRRNGFPQRISGTDDTLTVSFLVAEARKKMKAICIIMVVVLAAGGCTSMREVDLSAEELQSQIRSGELAQPGNRVAVVTAGGMEHTFEVVAVTEDVIRGESVEVPIGDIVSVHTEQLSPGKTAVATGGTVAVVYVIGAVMTAFAIINGIGSW
jgi:hypothetical protein